MINFYVEFKLWPVNKIVETPWRLVFIEYTNEYRNKRDLKPISPKAVQSIFMSFNEHVCANFLELNVPGYIYATIIPALNEEGVHQALSKEFKCFEVRGVCEVAMRKDSIEKIMGEG